MKKYFLFLTLLCSFSLPDSAKEVSVNLKSWLFSRDSINWQRVSVPHDWAISGPFDKKWDLQKVAIAQNGETEATEKSGRSGSLPWIGRGFYKTVVSLTREEALASFAQLQFDGAMADSHVWVNGRFVGGWPYGYNAFRLDVKGCLHEGENLIVVSLDNREESSRWYPGGGIYRPVQLVLSSAPVFNDWGTYFSTFKLEGTTAQVLMQTKVDNGWSGLRIAYDLRNRDDECVLLDTLWTEPDGKAGKVEFVKNAQLWSPENPYLYTLKASVLDKDGKVLADKHFHIGIRTVEVDSEGFRLNGVKRKIKGVCLHHDLGPLGVAVNRSALVRQILMMKEMGCDAIRTSHNMPSSLQMEVCDSLGMMVMAESFDMWRYAKCRNGYARFFNEWAEKDIENLVLNHRNHPSVIMWSIGNEIPEQWSQEGREISQRLQAVCHRLDPSRKVTQGMDNAEPALNSGFAQVMDIPGFNYRDHKYDRNISQLPQGFLLGSETCSTVSSRGVYKFPVEVTHSKNYPDGQSSSYDTEVCGWSNIPDDDFLMMDDRSYTIGQFVWTGYDYLGEPTPYDEYWPSRSSYFGICDLAGLPKDRYWLYRSQWNCSSHTLHLLPHWTWKGREGLITPVYCYTDFPEAELFVNGKSQGRIKKDLSQHSLLTAGRFSWDKPAPSDSEGAELANQKSILDRYRLRWNNVKYEPGELKVLAYDKNGNAVQTEVIKTAGEAKSLNLKPETFNPQPETSNLKPETFNPQPETSNLKPETLNLKPGTDDLCFITVSAVDGQGTLVPDCQDELQVEVKGAASFRGICNGDATSLEVFTEPHMHLFNGQLVVVVAAGETPGKAVVKVKGKKLKGQITINVK